MPVEEIALHAFGDASGVGVATTVYAMVQQPSGQSQGLIAAKTIPRLELVSEHMAVNLIKNVRAAIKGFPVTTLHWIWGNTGSSLQIGFRKSKPTQR